MAKGLRTQNNMILAYMRDHGSITSGEAIYNLGITRLSGRIYDLKHEGHIIKAVVEEGTNRYGDKTRYTRYSLVE